MELEKAIESYRRYAEIHGKALMEGDSRNCNKSYGKLMKLIKVIRGNGEKGNAALASLMNDEDDGGVKLCSATHLLNSNNQKAEQILQELSIKEGMLGFEAGMTLKEWGKGNLDNL